MPQFVTDVLTRLAAGVRELRRADDVEVDYLASTTGTSGGQAAEAHLLRSLDGNVHGWIGTGTNSERGTDSTVSSWGEESSGILCVSRSVWSVMAASVASSLTP